MVLTGEDRRETAAQRMSVPRPGHPPLERAAAIFMSDFSSAPVRLP